MIIFVSIQQEKGNHFFCMVLEALEKLRFASNLLKNMEICKCVTMPRLLLYDIIELS